MKYTIIEDCSPYYIRFTYPGIAEFINTAMMLYNNVSWSTEYTSSSKYFSHSRLPKSLGNILLRSSPTSKVLKLNPGRLSYFTSNPGLYYRAHKDGINLKYGINYTLKVLDDKCVTSWYSDDDLKIYADDKATAHNSRECEGFQKELHTPLKTMVAKQGEAILFNTDIYHDWDNRWSDNERIVLTLRPHLNDPISFFDARMALFNF